MRIHHAAERGHLAAPARQIAVEPVGERGQAENRRANERRRHAENRMALELRQQDDDQQRDQEDAGNGERVRQVHQPLSRIVAGRSTGAAVGRDFSRAGRR